ncbi:hypothetical protein ALT717_270022 [Alteromonas macleodii]
MRTSSFCFILFRYVLNALLFYSSAGWFTRTLGAKTNIHINIPYHTKNESQIYNVQDKQEVKN